MQLQTQPPLSQVLPNHEPVRIQLQARDGTGQPLSDVEFHLQLFAPPETPWLTTDFPIVEGTTLLDLSAVAPAGNVEFEQVLPIRGTYRLSAQVAPRVDGGFKPFQQSLPFSVAENPAKYRNAALLIGMLLLAGFGSGWIIGGDQSLQPGEVAPQRIRLLLSGGIVLAIAVLLLVNVLAELASAHSPTPHRAPSVTDSVAVQRSQGWKLHLSGDQDATVGQLATQSVQVVNSQTGQPEPDVTVSIKTIALDDHRLMFAYAGSTDAQGQITWKEQFFDGTPHQVRAETAIAGTRLRATYDVEVEAIAPPLSRRLISLGYFTAVFAISLGAGVGLYRRLRPSS